MEFAMGNAKVAVKEVIFTLILLIILFGMAIVAERYEYNPTLSIRVAGLLIFVFAFLVFIIFGQHRIIKKLHYNLRFCFSSDDLPEGHYTVEQGTRFVSYELPVAPQYYCVVKRESQETSTVSYLFVGSGGRELPDEFSVK